MCDEFAEDVIQNSFIQIGTAVGFGVGVAGSMIFDVVYDNKEKIASGVKDVADKVGDAISGVWGNVSSAFG